MKRKVDICRGCSQLLEFEWRDDSYACRDIDRDVDGNPDYQSGYWYTVREVPRVCERWMEYMVLSQNHGVALDDKPDEAY